MNRTFEILETRTVLDASAAFGVPFEPSEFVTSRPNGSLQFASLVVGEVSSLLPGTNPTLLEDSDIIEFRGTDINVANLKAYLHEFANSIGTDLFVETQDLRVSDWGSGSGSTTRQFEEFVESQIELFEPCEGLQFSDAVRFDLPGTGGEFFTGGFLDVRENGSGGLLRGGDIVEFFESHSISVSLERTELTVDAMFGEMVFTVNADNTLRDDFGRVWEPSGDYEIVDPNALDAIVGDINEDGSVNFADFLILSDNFGTASDQGDLNDDGQVNFADFLLLSENFEA